LLLLLFAAAAAAAAAAAGTSAEEEAAADNDPLQGVTRYTKVCNMLQLSSVVWRTCWCNRAFDQLLL
jgi:curli biogenesis system outer membrane secretion channel CsgG